MLLNRMFNPPQQSDTSHTLTSHRSPAFASAGKRSGAGNLPRTVGSTLCGALLVIAAAGACSSSGTSTTSQAPAASDSSDPGGSTQSTLSGSLTIGVLAPVTGSNPAEGRADAEAAKLAAADVNAHGGVNGKQLKLKIGDSAFNPSTSVTAFQKFASAGLPVVVGIDSSNQFSAVCPVAETLHEVLIGSGSTGQGLTDGKTYCFRASYQESRIAPFVVDLASQRGAKSVAIVTDKSPVGSSLAELWGTQAPQFGVKVATKQSFDTDASDLTSQALAVKKSGADAILYAGTNGPQPGILIRALVGAGVDVPVYATGAIASPAAISAGKDYYGKLPLVTDVTSYDAANPEAAALQAKINKAVGTTIFSGQANRMWDAVHVAAAALAKTQGKGGEALVQAVESITHLKVHSGQPGSYMDFSKNHTGLFGPFIEFYSWDASNKSWKPLSTKFSQKALDLASKS